MQEENEKQNETTDPQADQSAAEDQAPEETAPEEAPAAEEQAAEEPAAPEPAAEAEPAAEPAEQLSPKQRRKQARSRASGPAGPVRSPEDRSRERAEERARKASARSRWRAKRREKRRASPSEPVAATAPKDGAAESRKRKTRQGVVVSSKGDKTITVRTDAVRRHRVYGKVIRETNTLHAHDETNQAGEGDTVRVMECRPLSRTKRWRLVQVLEKAK